MKPENFEKNAVLVNAGTDRCRELENAAIVRNYAKLIVDKNRLVQFQWIEPQTKESIK